MSLLFQIINKTVQPNVETLLIPPFKQIWERDTDTQKKNAIEDFAYIEFCVSEKKSNPYSGYALSQREKKVKEDIITRENWKEDPLIVEAKLKLEKMMEEAAPSYSYYISTKKGAEKLQDFFLTFDMTTVNVKTGSPMYKPKEITSALNDTATVLRNLHDLREKVNNELFEKVKIKGEKVISDFANPDTL